MTQKTDKFDYKLFLSNLTSSPGIYQMLNQEQQIIYVGKAKNLKKRVASYFLRKGHSSKTSVMVKQICAIEVMITNSESEALILENNLIKKHKPRYNVLLRDDKSYPYVFISSEHEYPRLDIHRGAKRAKGKYFGPFPNVTAVRESINILQKLFKIRQCQDSYFANRRRPCLQYQINRCTAPCVKLIDSESYRRDVAHAMLFLEGKNQQIIDELIKQMEVASSQLDYETAMLCRDQIAHLRAMQQQQYVSKGEGNVDVIAIAQQAQECCVQVLFIRQGRILGNKSFYPKNTKEKTITEIISAFITQYYLNMTASKEIPAQIIVNQAPEQVSLITDVLSKQAKRKIHIVSNVRAERAKWLDMAINNVQQTLQHHLTQKVSQLQRVEALQTELQLPYLPVRMECFDISHTMGEATVASCVVFTQQGPLKSDYRKFNIEGITKGDDYGAMLQALTRRYKRIKEHGEKIPSLLIVDGGKGQLAQAQQVLEELGLSDIILLGIAKGEGRKPGLEKLYRVGIAQPIILKSDSLALHLLQQIRDEAHRFAITGHRQRRDKARKVSPLEEIPGIGAKRRRQLLLHFGGLSELKCASLEEITKVPGISDIMAQLIYDKFH